VRVTNTRNGESIVVRVNDRGPFHGNRVIDLSKAAAREIGMLRRGTARVKLELLPRL
jgi:rare lipoprotein A